jgi:hypothetical protein
MNSSNVIDELADIPFELPFDYTAEELQAIAELFEVERFPGVEHPVLPNLRASEREAAVDGARRSLFARGVLAESDSGEVEVALPHAALFTLVLSPGLAILAQRVVGVEVMHQAFYARPQLGVEQSRLASGLYRLQLFDPSELLRKVLRFTELPHRPRMDAPAWTDDVAALQRLDQLAATEERDTAAAEFPDAPASFINALFERVCTVQLGIVYRRQETEYATDISWIDGGESGLWQLEPESDNEGSSTRFSVRPVDAGELVDAIVAALPGGDG